MTTSPIIIFDVANALTIKADAMFSCPDLQSFSDLDDLYLGVPVVNPYATYESDFWLLDGSMKFMPALPHVGLMSASMSDSGDSFSFAPVLTITFGSVHSTDGLIFHFSQYTNDYASYLTVNFYDASNVLITSDDYNPTGSTFSTELTVSNFKKIIISFNETNKPYRYVRLTGIDFDALTSFSGTDIKEAQVVEQINPLAIELPINTLDVTLFSVDGDFSIVDPAGVYANFQYKEPLDVYENIDNEIIYIGRFYLDTWKSTSANLATFKAIDAVGLLDGLQYVGGFWTSNDGAPFDVAVEDLLANLFSNTNVDYDLDAALTGTMIEGSLPVGSIREALQQIAFAIGAYVTCARSNIIQIKPTVLASDLVVFDYTLTAADKGMESPVKLRPLITGIELKTHIYKVKYRNADTGDPVQFLSRAFVAGDHSIIFDELQYNLYITGGTIEDPVVGDVPAVFSVNPGKTFLNGYVNYIGINVASPGTVTLESEGTLEDNSTITAVYDGGLGADVPLNILSINDATLVHVDNAGTIAQLVFDYYAQRYLLETTLYAPASQVGDSVLVATQGGRQIAGIIESMSSDLAGGFRAKTKIIGVVVPL